MQKLKLIPAIIFLFTTLNAFAGHNGMPGCDGGTKPSADGKYYKPETHEQCNPGNTKGKNELKVSHHQASEAVI